MLLGLRPELAHLTKDQLGAWCLRPGSHQAGDHQVGRCRGDLLGQRLAWHDGEPPEGFLHVLQADAVPEECWTQGVSAFWRFLGWGMSAGLHLGAVLWDPDCKLHPLLLQSASAVARSMPSWKVVLSKKWATVPKVSFLYQEQLSLRSFSRDVQSPRLVGPRVIVKQ